MTLEEAIERHINSTGNGFELDDVISNGRFPDDVTDRIIELARKYRTAQYPIGTSNPDSFEELRSLASQYGRNAR